MTPNVSLALLRTQTDARLASLAAAGHDRAFEAIVERYRGPLLRYARSFRLDEGAAEDVVQASCVAAWASLRDGVAVEDLRPWLYRIVRNRSINALRAVRGISVPLVEALDDRPGPQAGLESREQVRDALDGIAALPDRQRAAIVAVAIDGRAHADVGEELGVSDMAVRKLVSRARGSLRAAATAITPMPIATWLAQATSATSDQAARIAELVTVGGTAGLAGGSMLKAGAVAVTIGAVAAGAPQVADQRSSAARPEAAQAAEARPKPTPADVVPDGGPAPADTVKLRTKDRRRLPAGSGNEPSRGNRRSNGEGSEGNGHQERSGPSSGQRSEPGRSGRDVDGDSPPPGSGRSGSEDSPSTGADSDGSHSDSSGPGSGRSGLDGDPSGSSPSEAAINEPEPELSHSGSGLSGSHERETPEPAEAPDAPEPAEPPAPASGP